MWLVCASDTTDRHGHTDHEAGRALDSVWYGRGRAEHGKRETVK